MDQIPRTMAAPAPVAKEAHLLTLKGMLALLTFPPLPESILSHRIARAIEFSFSHAHPADRAHAALPHDEALLRLFYVAHS